MATQEALRKARDQGLDLVEINPKASPPVCKILDYGKYKYDEKKKKRETKRKQSTVEVKEVKLRPKTDDHDLDFKARAARKFIQNGNKVKFTVRFRGREITHPQKARDQLVWIQDQCVDIANIEVRPTMEGRTMTMIMSPKQTVLQALANAKAEAEKQRKVAEDERRGQKRSARSNPGGSSPGASSPGSSKPSASKPSASKPSASKPSASKPDASDPGDASDAGASNAKGDKPAKNAKGAKPKGKGKGKKQERQAESS